MKNLVLCFALCAFLAGCQYPFQHTVMVEIDCDQDILDSLDKYSHYYGLYEIGDTISFLREDSTIEVYYVEEGTCLWKDSNNSPIGSIQSAGFDIMLRPTDKSVHQSTYIMSYVTIECPQSSKNRVHISNKLTVGENPLPEFLVEEGDIVATSNWHDFRCVLRRDVGIVYVQDDKNHSWTTILK